jgi:hypothetical protein
VETPTSRRTIRPPTGRVWASCTRGPLAYSPRHRPVPESAVARRLPTPACPRAQRPTDAGSPSGDTREPTEADRHIQVRGVYLARTPSGQNARVEWSEAETLRAGDEVTALSKDGPLPMRVLSGPVHDGEFEILWLCEPKDWDALQSGGEPGDEWDEWRVPWPLEAVRRASPQRD